METPDVFLQRMINWLEARRIINLLLVFGYFTFIFLMHVPCAKLSVFVQNKLSLPVYNNVVIGNWYFFFYPRNVSSFHAQAIKNLFRKPVT